MSHTITIEVDELPGIGGPPIIKIDGWRYLSKSVKDKILKLLDNMD